MNKYMKFFERPKHLGDILLELKADSTITIYTTAFKTAHVRTTVCRLNKKLNKKTFTVSDKGMTDRCVVTRLQ